MSISRYGRDAVLFFLQYEKSLYQLHNPMPQILDLSRQDRGFPIGMTRAQ
jgi:hypothetical protein